LRSKRPSSLLRQSLQETMARDSTEITIPMDTRVLGEFLAELLGQRRSIERTFDDRRFEIDMSWLLNLDAMLNNAWPLKTSQS
jgi:hypothetical protein